jgi:hypothetical protein
MAATVRFESLLKYLKKGDYYIFCLAFGVVSKDAPETMLPGHSAQWMVIRAIRRPIFPVTDIPVG